MKKIFYLLTIGILAFSIKGNCQYNLVPDPSFESFTSCPVSVAFVPYLTYWTEGLENVSPDYMNACNNTMNGLVGVPSNRFGHQLARTGLGYVGICTAYDDTINPILNYREYVQTELIDTLNPGVEYTVNYYVSAADSCGRLTNSFGAYFSSTEIDTIILPGSNAYLPFQPQVENSATNYLGDRIGWTLVTGTFIATGGEKFLILGNFRPHLTTTITLTGWGTWPPNMKTAYLYVDDVLVAPTDSLTSINEINSNDELSLSTLNNNEFEITSKYHSINAYEVVNCLGQIIDKKVNVNENSLHLNLEECANGIYFVRVQLQNEKSEVFKIFKH